MMPPDSTPRRSSRFTSPRNAPMEDIFFCFMLGMMVILIGIPVYGFNLLAGLKKQQEDGFTTLRRELRDLKKELVTQRSAVATPAAVAPPAETAPTIIETPPSVAPVPVLAATAKPQATEPVF